LPIPDEAKDTYEGVEQPGYPRNTGAGGRRSSSSTQYFKNAWGRGSYLLPPIEERPHTPPLVRLSRDRVAAVLTLVAGAVLLAAYWVEEATWTRFVSSVALTSGVGLALVGGTGLLWVVWKGPARSQEQLLEDFEGTAERESDPPRPT